MTNATHASDWVVSIRTAVVLSGLSLRTWQRRIQEGLVAPLGGSGMAALVPLAAVAEWLPGWWGPDELAALVAADGGDVLAQAELGSRCVLHLLQPGPASGVAGHEAGAEGVAGRVAWHFLSEAAEQGQADAMHWLGLACAAGRSDAGDGDAARAQALMWLSRAAAQGHVIAREQMTALMRGAGVGVSAAGPRA